MAIEPAPQADARGRRRLLGEMLVAQGIISQDQLAEVLHIQKHEKSVRIGSLLIEFGYVTEAQLADLIADQLRLPTADLHNVEAQAEAIAKVPKDLATKHRCLPWMIEGRELLLVMADPTDVAAMDAVRFHTGLRVRPVVGPESEVVAAIERAYSDDSINEFVDNLQLTDHLALVDEPDTDVGSEADLQRAALAAPVTKLVNAIFVDAIRIRASDIHIEPQQKGTILRYRVDGALRHVMTMPKRAHPKVISRIKVAAHMDIAERRRPQDGRTRMVLNGDTFDLRISSLPTADGEKIVIRILARNNAKTTLEELGFEPDTLEIFKKLLRQPQGMILVTGPTGSGKTSTLYAALNFLTHESTNIVTIEDPVEYRLHGINQVAVSEKAGLTFAAGLRSILRQDPNIVMVGEIRDAETAQVAFHAAQTGHLVLSTLHTNDAPSAVTRLVDMGVPAYLVSSSVIGVLAQRLVRKLCACKVPLPNGQAQPGGCDLCKQAGFRGRVAINELLRLTPRVRQILMADASPDSVRRAAIEAGMIGMFEDGERKVSHGMTIIEEVEKVVSRPDFDDTITEVAARQAVAPPVYAAPAAAPVNAAPPAPARAPQPRPIDRPTAPAPAAAYVATPPLVTSLAESARAQAAPSPTAAEPPAETRSLWGTPSAPEEPVVSPYGAPTSSYAPVSSTDSPVAFTPTVVWALPPLEQPPLEQPPAPEEPSTISFMPMDPDSDADADPDAELPRRPLSLLNREYLSAAEDMARALAALNAD